MNKAQHFFSQEKKFGKAMKTYLTQNSIVHHKGNFSLTFKLRLT